MALSAVMGSWTDCLRPEAWHSESYRSLFYVFVQKDWLSCLGFGLEDFPDELRCMIYQIFAFDYPACVYWGSDLRIIYNSAFMESFISTKHPAAMGQTWQETWGKDLMNADRLYPKFLRVFEDGRPNVSQRTCVFLSMDEHSREIFYDTWRTPIRNARGQIGGLFCTVHETTSYVVAERRQRLIETIQKTKSRANTQLEVFDTISRAAQNESIELPCFLIYHCDESSTAPDERTFSMTACVGSDRKVADMSFSTTEVRAWKPTVDGSRSLKDCLLEALHTLRPLQVTDSQIIAEICQRRSFGDSTRTLWLSPIFCYGDSKPTGVVIQGLNPRGPQTDTSFVKQFTEEVQSCLVNVHSKMHLRSELKSRNTALADSRKKLQAMFEASPAGMYILNLTTETFEFVNDAYYEITGIPKEAGIARWAEYIHPDDLDQALHVWDNLRQVPISNFQARWKTPWRDDIERWTNSSAIIHEDEDGTKYAFGAFTDASAVKYALKVERERADAAIQTKRQQLDFLDMIAHELRNPLGAIMQTSDFLVDKLSENASSPRTVAADDVEDLKTIVLCAQHMSRIINDTLNLSKLEGGMLIATHVPTQPVAVVKSVLAIFEAEAKRNETSLSYVVDPSIQSLNVDWVLTDPSRLAQIIINFLANSIKFVGKSQRREVQVTIAASTEPMKTSMPTAEAAYINEESSIERLRRTSGAGTEAIMPLFLTCHVSDTGPGMSQKQVSSLFQRYFQASPKTHVEYGGSGLGLFISKQLVALLNGTIDVESVEHEGTTFSFCIETIPCEAPITEVIPAELNVRTKPSRRQYSRDTILIAEDNLINQKIMVKQLSNAGYQTLVANNGREAIDLLVQDNKGPKRIAICLCDIEMPILGGIDTIKEVRRLEQAGELDEHCPFIAVTANARQEQVVDMLEAGMDDQVPKPLRFKVLVAKITDLLARLNKAPLFARRRSSVSTLPQSAKGEKKDAEKSIIPERSDNQTMRHRSLAQLWKSAELPTQPFDLILLNTQSPTRIAPLLWRRAGLMRDSLRVCTDGATDRLHREVFQCALESLPAQERPDIVIGDLDSIEPATRSFYESIRTTRVLKVEDQNSTDFTKAINQINEEHPESDIIVLGGIGGRLDQTFSTINTLFTRPRIYILDTDNVVFLLLPGKHEIDCLGLGRHCGLVPMGAAVKCWSTGLEWCLNGETMEVGGLISTNNRVVDDAGLVTVDCDGPILFSIELNM